MKEKLIQLANKDLNTNERKKIIESLKNETQLDNNWIIGYQLELQLELAEGNYQYVNEKSNKLLNKFEKNSIFLAINAEAKLKLGYIDDASKIYIKAANLSDDNHIINFNCANNLRILKKFDEAIYYYKKSIKIKKDFLDAYLNLGATYQDLGMLSEAEKEYRKINKINPFLASPYVNLAKIRYAAGEYILAKNLIEYSLTLKTLTEDARNWAQVTIARIEDHVHEYKNSAMLFYKLRNTMSKDYYYLTSYFSFAQKHCEIESLIWLEEKITNYYSNEKNRSRQEVYYEQFSLLACQSMTPELLLKSITQKVEILNRLTSKYDHDNSNVKKKLKIGYLTADFRDHPIAHLMLGVIKNHNREKFEVYGYDLGPQNYTIYRYKAILYLDKYICVNKIPSDKIAEIINKDGIDILIDLVGYTEFCQPKVLNFRPAPVQISYLGFVGTTGLDGLDYIIADKIVIPPEEQINYSEKPIYLPRCFQATDGTLEFNKLNKSEFGLPSDKFIFGSLNNSYKINQDFISKSSAILKKCSDSVIWLYSANSYTEENIKKYYLNNGISENRIYFYKRSNKSKFLAALEKIDLFLDSTPYNAGTTASDAIYAGTPLLTQIGRTYSSRMAASILNSCGLDELICNDSNDYIRKAIELYSSKEFYSYMKNKTVNAKNSRLFDTVDATKCLEKAYLLAYEDFTKGIKNPIYVSDSGWNYNSDNQTPYAGTFLSDFDVKNLKEKISTNGLNKIYLNNLNASLRPL